MAAENNSKGLSLKMPDRSRSKQNKHSEETKPIVSDAKFQSAQSFQNISKRVISSSGMHASEVLKVAD